MPIGVRLDPEHLAAPGGTDVDGAVVLTNQGDQPVHVRIVVSGEVAGWATVEPADVWVPPHDEVASELRFRLPRGAPGGIGAVPFVVRVLSDSEGEGGASAPGSLEVTGEAELALRLMPARIRGTLKATTKVAIDNLGDTPARAQLLVEAADAGIEADPDSLIIEPHGSAFAHVTVRPRARHLSGPPKAHEFWVRADPLGGARLSAQGTMLQRSLVAGFLPAATAGAVALAVAVVLLARVLGSGAGNGDGNLATTATLPTATTAAPTTTTPTPTTQAAATPGATTTTVPLKERRLAFQTKRDGNYEVYSSNPDGTDPKNLTQHPGHDGEPAWSPDHTRIAFDSDRGGNFDVFVMSADGTNPVQLTTEPAPDGYPTWSPDGTRIAFISFRDGNSEIYVMNADGTDPKNISNTPAADKNPAWSPNSARIAFDSTRDGSKPELYVMGADGSLPTRLTTDDDVDAWPAWSPDGARLAFQTDRDSDLELYTVSAGGGAPRRLTTSPAEDGEAAW